MRKVMEITFIILLLCFGITGVVASTDIYNEELDFAGSFCNGYAIVGKYDGSLKCGYINSNGKLVIKPQYDYCDNFFEDLAVVGMGKDYSNMKYGYIKPDGSYLFKPQFDSAESMKNGLAIIGIKNGKTYKSGLINNKGRIIIEPKYDLIDVGGRLTEKGYVTITQGSQHGLFNLNTGKVIEPEYKSIILMDNYIRVSKIVDGKEKYGLILFDGKVIEPAFDGITYSRNIDNVLCMAEINGKVGLMGYDGKYLLEPKYDEISSFNDGIIMVKSGKLYGYLDSSIKPLTEIEFEMASGFSKGLASIQKNGKWGILKIDGTYLADPVYDQVHILGNEIEVIENGEKMILNLDGNYKYDKDYTYLYPYSSIEGKSKVKKNGKELIVDSNGKPIFKMDFDTIGEFQNGIAYITLNGKVGYLKREDKYLVKPIYDSTFKDDTESYYHTKLNEKWGLVFEDGTVIDPISDGPIIFKNDYGIIRVGNKQTYIDKKSQRLTSETFDYCGSFCNGMGRMVTNSKTSYIDKNGKNISQTFEWGEDFSDGYACVNDNQHYRFIDKEGKFAFGDDSKYYLAKSFSNGLAAVADDKGKWGYIDTKGKMIIQAKFDCAFNFDQRLAPVKVGEKFGFIDKKGNIVIKPEYDRGEEFVNGTANVWKGNKFSYITSNGEIKNDSTKNENLKFVDGLAPARTILAKDNRYYWGYIRTDGSWIIEPEFDYASILNDGKGYVHKNGKQADVFKDGTITWK